MFYLVEITTYLNGTPDAKGIYSYNTRDEAVAAYHNKMSGAMRNENYGTELLTVFAENGATVLSDYWVRTVEPSPEPEE